ncbi:hypothetical protein LMJF_31_2380 [Leishmania major strain Friedlin]|uniref:Uncharacterized protein n=1 Tax=Leishmania major TaxID=5664 RepID=Q4Q623_LEIMA|nr:hypothetical protein LMJF_31_2380 [Leishmania major strain Friedlin]CAG9579416.1 hypothetical_protein_-_conserved [Leishmania major strain Friedlin]CAJ08427.1 hypothetical protein LMJF_31_2380 [Leishmania major strain Friedlin]|eukprot:XP_001685225.1 hypothetical protein LMJF_31_2380 [Leishmania major strain Friedlin]
MISAMQYLSQSSSTTSLHAEPFGSSTPMCSMMGPYTMSDEGPARPPAMMGSAAGLAMAFSAFSSGFYGHDDAAHPYKPAASLREGPRSGATSHQGVSLAAQLYEYAESSCGCDYSRVTLYGAPCAREAAVHDCAIAAAAFAEPRFGSAHRTNSFATSGTALSDCHLSRKDGGGFTPASARTFLNSDDSFGGRSVNSRRSLRDSLTAPASSMSCSVRGSVGSGYYLDTTFRGDEHNHDRVACSADGAVVLSAAQHRLSDSIHLASQGGSASRLSSENIFSLTQRLDAAESGTTNTETLHVQPHLHLSGFSTSQNDRFVSPRKRGTIEDDTEHVSANTASPATALFGNEFGPTGCSPFYDLGTVALESNKAGQSRSAVLKRDNVVPTTTAENDRSRHFSSVQRRPASERQGTVGTGRSASVSSASSTATSVTPRQPSVLPKTLSGASTEPKKMTCSLGSVDKSKPPAGQAPQSASRKPRRKDPRKWNNSRSTSITASNFEKDGTASSTSSSSPAASRATTDTHRQKATATALAGAPPATRTDDESGCRSFLASPPQQPLQQQLNPARAPNSTTTTFTISPPSYNERHQRPFLRRRYLEGQVKPLNATEMQMAMVPFSPRRDVPPSRSSASGPATQALLKPAVPLQPLQCDQVTLPGTARAWSPSGTVSSSASFSVTPEKFITVASGGGAWRTQQRLAGFTGFHLSIGMEGLCVTTESSNEKSPRSLGGRSGTELRLPGESSNGIMSRSCPSVEYSVDEGTNPFLIQRSASWSVHSARSITDSGEVPGIARKKRHGEHVLSNAHDLEEEHVTMHPKPSR